MRIPELVEQMGTRLQRLNLVDEATGRYDPEEAAEYVLVAMRYLSNRWNLLHFYELSRNLLQTVVGIEAYQIPPHYGFVVPEEPDYSGLAITETDGTSPRNLEWYPPQKYELLRNTTTGKPVRFTLADNMLWLQPTPDAAYWIQAIDKPNMDATSDIPEAYREAVIVEALYRMASDQQKMTEVLLEERNVTTRTLVNGEARLKTRFQASSYNRSLRGSTRRWGRR